MKGIISMGHHQAATRVIILRSCSQKSLMTGSNLHHKENAIAPNRTPDFPRQATERHKKARKSFQSSEKSLILHEKNPFRPLRGNQLERGRTYRKTLTAFVLGLSNFATLTIPSKTAATERPQDMYGYSVPHGAL